MANTTTHAPGVITIVLDGSTDWSYITDGGFSAGIGIKVTEVQFIPSAANDRLKIRNKTVTGTIIHDSGPTPSTAAWYDPVDPPKWEYPMIEADDLTLTTPANALVMIKYA